METAANRYASCVKCGFTSAEPAAFLAVRGNLGSGYQSYCRYCWRNRFHRRNTRVIVMNGLCLAMGTAVLALAPRIPTTEALIDIAWLSVNIAVVSLLGPFYTVLHELAHALAAKATGLRLFRVQIGYGRTLFIHRVAGIDLHFNALLYLGGVTYTGHLKRTLLRTRQAALVMAGPLANLLLAGILELALGRPSIRESLDQLFRGPAFLQAMLLSNLLIAGMSLFPTRINTAAGANTTDGMKLVSLLKFKPEFADTNLLNQWIFASAFALQDEDFALAVQQATKGLELNSGDPQLLNNFGIAKLGQLEFKAGREAFVKVLEKREASDHPAKSVQVAESLNNIAYADLLIGGEESLREANEYSQRACRLVPREFSYEETRGCVLIELRRYAEGRDWLSRTSPYVTQAQCVAIHHAYLALANARLGDAAVAEVHASKARENGEHPVVRRILARLNEPDPPVAVEGASPAESDATPAAHSRIMQLHFEPKSWQAVFLGFLLAPLASAVLQGLTSLSPAAGVFTLPFAYLLSWILGVPGYFLFRRFGWLRPWQVISAGGGAGVAVAVIVFWGMGQNVLGAATAFAAALFMAHGAVVAAAFCWIAIGYRGTTQVG